MLPFPMIRRRYTPRHSFGSRFTTRHPLSSTFSYCYALFCTPQNHNSFRFIFFRTPCKKHPGWGVFSFSENSVRSALKSTRSITSLDPFDTRQCLPATIACRIRTSPKRARNSRRMCSSKTQDLKPFRIRSSDYGIDSKELIMCYQRDTDTSTIRNYQKTSGLCIKW